MSQEQVLKAVDDNPGIKRTKVHTIIDVSAGTACEQIRKLLTDGLLVQVKAGQTFKLYRNNGSRT